MKKVKVTVFNTTRSLVLKIGEEVTLVHDPDSKGMQFDPKVFNVFAQDGEEIGVVGNKHGQTVIDGCLSNVELFDQVEPLANKESNGLFRLNGVVYEQGEVTFRNGHKKIAYVLVVKVPEAPKAVAPTNMKEFVLNVRGSIREFKGKTNVLKEIQDGNSFPLSLKKNDDGKLITYFMNGDDEVLAGSVSKAEVGDLDQLVAYTEALAKSGQAPKAKATVASGNSYTVEFKVSPKDFQDILDGKVIKTLEQIKEDKLSEGIANEETLEEIQAYLEENKVEERLIKGVFESMILYPEHVRHRIRKPKTPYVNMGLNMVRKAVVYMNKGKHLNFIGDKGIGKNVLIETLSWIYQRPLYSAGYHSQIDKMDILGGKTFETEVEDGQAVTKMEFEKELLVEAMEVGGIMNPDEINAADPSVLFIFHPVTDDRRELEVPGLGLVKAHEKFNVITTMNEDYVGTNDLNEAFKRRFTHFRFPAAETIADLLSATRPEANPNDIRLCDKVYGSVLKLVKTGQLTNDCIAVSNYKEALDVVEDLGLQEALIDNIANQISDESYRSTIETIIDDMVG